MSIKTPDPWDPDIFRISPEELNIPKEDRNTSPRARPGQSYLSHAPWPWLDVAIRLPNQALAVGLMLWHVSNCTKRFTVRFSAKIGGRCGFSHDTVSRSLAALEKAGLVKVTRHPGCSPLVTLLRAPVLVEAEP
jgi:DNA-binding transcriptional ArsR family regulator